MTFFKSARYAVGGLLFSQSLVNSTNPLWIGFLWALFAVLVFGVQFAEIRHARVARSRCDVSGCLGKATQSVLVGGTAAPGGLVLRLCSQHDPRATGGFSIKGKVDPDHMVH